MGCAGNDLISIWQIVQTPAQTVARATSKEVQVALGDNAKLKDVLIALREVVAEDRADVVRFCKCCFICR